MFERNKVDQTHKTSVAVEVTLEDGRTLSGVVISPPTRGIGEELNTTGGFIEFETHNGERAYIAKHAIRSVKTMVAARAEQLDRRSRQMDSFDPHAILGLPKSADRAAIRQAYHNLAKAYHPDRLAGMGLPQEILDYATTMAKRINAAYSAIGGGPAPSTASQPQPGRGQGATQ